MKVCALVVVVILCRVAQAAKQLPPYIKPCALSDPDFNKCALEHGRAAIPFFVKGDRRYRIPSLEPVVVSEIKVEQGAKQAGFTLTMKDVSVYGLNETWLVDNDYQFDKLAASYVMRMPRLEVLGKYKVGGRVLVLPISGEGDINITLVDTTINFNYNYEVKNNRMAIADSRTLIDPKRAYFHLTNLFGGDKLLGDQMNNFINENWKDVLTEFAPTVASAFGQVGVTIVNNIAEEVPYDVIYPAKLP